MRLRDKVALVTGAAGGIGREIARAFAREGARVAIADLDQDAAERTVAELVGEGRQAIATVMDVASEAQVEAGMARVIEAYGRIDILVSNAGVQRVCPLEALSFEDWRQVLAVHLDGAFLTTRAALRQM